MRGCTAAMLGVLMIFGTVPARADFKYSDTSKITGGTLKSMMKTVGIFSKQASQAMKPITTTRYIKGDRMRSDDADGQIQIIDLAGRRILSIDPQKHTYTEITFDEMKASIAKATQQMQQPKPATKDADGKPPDVKANVNAKVTVTPGTSSRQIQGVTANEMTVKIDMEIQAQQQNAPAGQPNGQASGTMTTTVDSWVAPSVPGYDEVAAFYQRMAKEVNWVPPSSIHVDPRVSQSMDEVQKNQTAYKGLPLLQYLSMTMVGQQGTAGGSGDNGSGGSNGNASSSSTNDGPPTSASDAMVKGLGGLFGKRKKKDNADDQANPNNPPPPSTPGSLIEMTIEVTNFSNAALDASLFQIPDGYTRVKQNPDQILQPSKP
jgi:hypothetical protein